MWVMLFSSRGKMRIHDTDKREREWEMLQEATGEATISGALDVATK